MNDFRKLPSMLLIKNSITKWLAKLFFGVVIILLVGVSWFLFILHSLLLQLAIDSGLHWWNDKDKQFVEYA